MTDLVQMTRPDCETEFEDNGYTFEAVFLTVNSKRNVERLFEYLDYRGAYIGEKLGFREVDRLYEYLSTDIC